MPSSYSVLDIGSGANPAQFPDAVVVRVDINPETRPDIVHDIREPFPPAMHGTYDVVYCSHMLEHIPYKQVIGVLKNMGQVLRENGECHVIVPALEWVAREVAKDNPSPALQGALFGSQENEWQFHRSGFTLSLLRQVMTMAGLTVRLATQSYFGITTNTGSESEQLHKVTQNVVVAYKGVDWERRNTPAADDVPKIIVPEVGRGSIS